MSEDKGAQRKDPGSGPETRVTLPEGAPPQRLDRALAQSLPALSRSRIKSLIDGGHVTLAGAPVRDAAVKAKSGQTFAIVIPDPQPAAPRGQDIPLEILFEDEDLIVINKPAGLVVHPAAGNPDGTLVNALIAHCGASLTGIGGELRPGIVHRLDKDTSGIMVAAKTEAAHRDLVSQFAERSIARHYAAFAWGVPKPRDGEYAGNIGRSPANRKKMAVLDRGGRPALTRYRVEETYGGGRVSRLTCRLKTGRTHQIRVHLSHAGHALLGDPLYGGRKRQNRSGRDALLRRSIETLGRQALHAQSLGFRHPRSGELLSFESPLPNDLKALKTCLESL